MSAVRSATAIAIPGVSLSASRSATPIAVPTSTTTTTGATNATTMTTTRPTARARRTARSSATLNGSPVIDMADAATRDQLPLAFFCAMPRSAPTRASTRASSSRRPRAKPSQPVEGEEQEQEQEQEEEGNAEADEEEEQEPEDEDDLPSAAELMYGTMTAAGRAADAQADRERTVSKRRRARQRERVRALAAAGTESERRRVRREWDARERNLREAEAMEIAGAVLILPPAPGTLAAEASRNNGNNASGGPLLAANQEPTMALDGDNDDDAPMMPSDDDDDGTDGDGLVLVDGQYVLRPSTSTIVLPTRPAPGSAGTAAAQGPVLEESSSTRRYYNQSRYTKGAANRVSSHWRTDEVDSLYDGLRLWGLNFEAIARTIPSKTRLNVRNKYNTELRHNPDRIDAALMAPRTASTDTATAAATVNEYADAAGVDVAELMRAVPLEMLRAAERAARGTADADLDAVHRVDAEMEAVTGRPAIRVVSDPSSSSSNGADDHAHALAALAAYAAEAAAAAAVASDLVASSAATSDPNANAEDGDGDGEAMVMSEDDDDNNDATRVSAFCSAIPMIGRAAGPPRTSASHLAAGDDAGDAEDETMAMSDGDDQAEGGAMELSEDDAEDGVMAMSDDE
ncbi:hypothetical protein BC828DRAFT_389732 [Blastocladiella britannica]|nr:hypothetical protein BC828DRAFT_389732 [Blastocladiella britannica]